MNRGFLLSALLLHFFSSHAVSAQNAQAVIAKVRESRERLATYDVRVTWSDAEGIESARHRGNFHAQSHRIDFNTNESSSVILHSDRMIYMAGLKTGQSDIVVENREPRGIPYLHPMDIRAVGLTNFLPNNDVECASRILSEELEGDQLAVIASNDAGVVKIASEVTFRFANGTTPGVRIYAIDTHRGHTVDSVDVHVGASLADVKRFVESGEGKPSRYVSIRTEWKQLGSDWVPTMSQVINGPDSGDSQVASRTVTVQFDWKSVNEPIDPALLEYHALALPGAKVYDARVNPPILIEQLPIKLQPVRQPPEGESP